MCMLLVQSYCPEVAVMMHILAPWSANAVSQGTINTTVAKN